MTFGGFLGAFLCFWLLVVFWAFWGKRRRGKRRRDEDGAFFVVAFFVGVRSDAGGGSFLVAFMVSVRLFCGSLGLFGVGVLMCGIGRLLVLWGGCWWICCVEVPLGHISVMNV